MATTLIAYLLIVLFSLTEGRLRKGQQAQTLAAGESDRSSTRRLGAAYAIASLTLLLAPVLNYLSIGHIGFPGVGWIGLVIMGGGISLRLWANLILGEFYTRTLRVSNNQSVVQRGPYRFIRHPGYLGTILMWTGAGLAVTNWIAFLIVLMTMCFAYHYRIRVEEAMLLEQLGQPYTDYRAHTWRLLPFLY